MPSPSSLDDDGPRILVLDDNFPNPLSGFRVAEYNFYFDVFPTLSVACSTQHFDAYSDSYNAIYCDYAQRYTSMSSIDNKSLDLCYVNFLNNAFAYLPYIEKLGAPFIFTLYPGGGFELDDQLSVDKLATVLRSPLLRGVISTQGITSTVLTRMGCTVPVHEIYGAAINPIYTAARHPFLNAHGTVRGSAPSGFFARRTGIGAEPPRAARVGFGSVGGQLAQGATRSM